jgi:hypothetical protein
LVSLFAYAWRLAPGGSLVALAAAGMDFKWLNPLGRGGTPWNKASWALAIGGVAAWTWYDQQQNAGTFSKDEQAKWNAKVEKKHSKRTPGEEKK